MNGRYEEINIDDIVPSENVRMDTMDKDLEYTMESIKQIGLLQPPGLKKLQDHEYKTLWGNRRIRAYQCLGYKKILAFVTEEEMTEEQFLDINLMENTQRKDLSPIEEGRIYCYLKEKRKMTNEEIAVKYSIPTRRVKSAIEIFLKIPPEYRSRIQPYTKSGGRRLKGGNVSSSSVINVINVIQEHKLDKKQASDLYEYALRDDSTSRKVEFIGRFMKMGYTLEEAVSKLGSYHLYRFSEVPINKDQFDRLLKEKGMTQIEYIMDLLRNQGLDVPVWKKK